MASKTDENNQEEAAKNQKIDALITSQRYFDIMCKIMQNEVSKAVNTTSLSPDQKSHFEKRFNEIFQAAISGNVTLGISTQSKESSSSSNTVIMQDKRRYLNEILLPKWERTLVKTTFKRKYYPRECARLLHLRLKKEKKKLLVKEAIENGALLSSLPSESFPDSVKDTIRTTAENLNSFTMGVQSKIDKVDRLLRSKQILDKIKTCKTNAVVFEENRTSNSQTLSSIMRREQLIVRGFQPLFQQ
ncbi:uncharacterized protein LOC106471446 [Limulus polyphemus]|uniref:Uncharacterized protein LOC106471446 n=1 Tax=Limulus polyphemus TaxID=6850 RepID=A0ABM1TIQ9_LIMPO|nr:uncharacterized protein LOC106471446 [Limulus polyphemus]